MASTFSAEILLITPRTSVWTSRRNQLALVEQMPERVRGHRADIDCHGLWPTLAEHALRPIGQNSLDDEWSAMRFRPLERGEVPLTGGA